MRSRDIRPSLATGAVVAGRYRVLSTIEEGARGSLHLVEHVHVPGQRFALKVLHTDADAAARARFLGEARALLRLVHPGIVVIRDVFEEGGALAFAMDHVPGPTLARVLAEGGPLAPERAAARAVEVLDALAAAHAAGLVHRDLSPRNILLPGAHSPEERARVVDFGIAALLDAAAGGRPPAVEGTPGYLSPEQARGLPCDGRADLYALGAILTALLTGRPPFLAESVDDLLRMHRDEPAPRLRALAPRARFPAGLEEAIARALEKDRARRFESALAMRAALLPFAPEALRRAPAASLEATTPAPASPRDVGDADVTSRGEPASSAPSRAALEFAARARLTLAPGLSPDGLRTVYVLACERLRVGRSRPGQSDAARDNTLVLRVLPCRDEARDPVNFRLTQGISASHATIEGRGARLVVTDHSRGGTWLDGVRLEAGRATPLPSRFRLALFDALELVGRLVEDGDARGGALLLGRRANAPETGYLWVRGRASIGAGEGAAIRVARGEGTIERVAGAASGGGGDGDARLRMRLPEGVSAAASEVGEEGRGE